MDVPLSVKILSGDVATANFTPVPSHSFNFKAKINQHNVR